MGMGWIMYLRHKGDPGFSSRNQDYKGPESATIDYVLSNGQRDLYPASWALPISVVNRALAHFRKENRPPRFVFWHNDSGDGATIEFAPAARPFVRQVSDMAALTRGRNFQLWQYHVSHGSLLIRSPAAPGVEKSVDIICSEATQAEVERLGKILLLRHVLGRSKTRTNGSCSLQ